MWLTQWELWSKGYMAKDPERGWVGIGESRWKVRRVLTIGMADKLCLQIVYDVVWPTQVIRDTVNIGKYFDHQRHSSVDGSGSNMRFNFNNDVRVVHLLGNGIKFARFDIFFSFIIMDDFTESSKGIWLSNYIADNLMRFKYLLNISPIM